MTLEELRTYVLSHTSVTEAFHLLRDRLKAKVIRILKVCQTIQDLGFSIRFF